jgi:hypothetical protein
LETNQAVESFLKSVPSYQWIGVLERNLIDDPEIQVARCLAFLEQPLALPSDLRQRIYRGRDDEWKLLLSFEEKKSLARFVERHHTELNSDSPGIVKTCLGASM